MDNGTGCPIFLHFESLALGKNQFLQEKLWSIWRRCLNIFLFQFTHNEFGNNLIPVPTTGDSLSLDWLIRDQTHNGTTVDAVLSQKWSQVSYLLNLLISVGPRHKRRRKEAACSGMVKHDTIQKTRLHLGMFLNKKKKDSYLKLGIVYIPACTLHKCDCVTVMIIKGVSGYIARQQSSFFSYYATLITK